MHTFELNNARKDSQFANPKLNPKSKMVEIFSAVAFGEDTSKFGKDVDTVMNHVKELSSKAEAGDQSAKSEINTIVRYTLEPKLQASVRLFDFMGTFRNIGFDEEARVRTYKHESVRSQFQASRGDVPFATTNWEEYTIGTQTISSGYSVNYREVQSGNLDRVAEGMMEVQKNMQNLAMNYVISQMYKGIKNATGVKYFAENAGIQKSAVDDVLKKVRRFGRPSIAGDYSVASQLNAFDGYSINTPASANVPEAALEEIRKTGLLSSYNGSPIAELPNQYDLSALNQAGDNFETVLPEGLLFFIPQGSVSPLQVFQKGGLSSMTGTDVTTGQEITRFDIEIGADVARGREYEIGLLSDTNFDTPEM